MFSLIKYLAYGFLTFTLYFPSDEVVLTFEDPRDGNVYEYIELNGLKWMKENLRYEVVGSMTVSDSTDNCEKCGEFYSVDAAFEVCPEHWRLPKESEVKSLIKWHKKRKQSLNESLSILLCGRVDNGKHAKVGEQNTFWMDSKISNGHVSHWHTFQEKQEIHSHDVVNANRQFPVRCVCEIE